MVTPAAGARAAQATVLKFEDGRTVVVAAAAGLVLVGRNPASAPGDGRTNLVPVDDPGRTVSKTHFACWRDQEGLWLVDRHSTNGTAFTTADGRLVTVPPGTPTRIPAQTTIHFGSHRAETTSQP